jgi:hypothetical protein
MQKVEKPFFGAFPGTANTQTAEDKVSKIK